MANTRKIQTIVGHNLAVSGGICFLPLRPWGVRGAARLWRRCGCRRRKTKASKRRLEVESNQGEGGGKEPNRSFPESLGRTVGGDRVAGNRRERSSEEFYSPFPSRECLCCFRSPPRCRRSAVRTPATLGVKIQIYAALLSSGSAKRRVL